MFLCVVFFGLFHGLLFLPVVLGLVGSTDKAEAEVEDQNMNSKS